MDFLLDHIDGLVQDCCNSSALGIELLQSCINKLIYDHDHDDDTNLYWKIQNSKVQAS